MKNFPPRTDGPSHCAVVTGAAGGIGLCFCRELATRGCDILMVDRVESALVREAKVLADRFPALNIKTLCLDLTDHEAIRRLENFCRLNNIDPDILINNAGIFSFRTVAETPKQTIDTFVDLHVRGVTLLSHWFVNRRITEGDGWLLNMSSMSCWMPMPGLAMYAATKSFIRVFSRSLRHEVSDYGISVTVACPGGIATNLFGLSPRLMKLAVTIRVIQTPEKFVRRAVNKLIAGRQQYINGWLNRLSIVAVAMTPSAMRRAVKHRLLDRGITR